MKFRVEKIVSVFERAKLTFKMLPASWFLVYFLKGLDLSILYVNRGSAGRRAAKLPSL